MLAGEKRQRTVWSLGGVSMMVHGGAARLASEADTEARERPSPGSFVAQL